MTDMNAKPTRSMRDGSSGALLPLTLALILFEAANIRLNTERLAHFLPQSLEACPSQACFAASDIVATG